MSKWIVPPVVVPVVIVVALIILEIYRVVS